VRRRQILALRAQQEKLAEKVVEAPVEKPVVVVKKRGRKPKNG
jgi:hypothetical protein